MQPTTEILEKVRQNSARNSDEIFTRLYRYLLRPDMYYLAYKKLYANKGAGTKGVDDDTADGFSEEKISNIIMDFHGIKSPLNQVVVSAINLIRIPFSHE